MAEVMLEIVCGRCGHWLQRWTVDTDSPFDEQWLEMSAAEPLPGRTVRQQWVPNADMTHSEWSRLVFFCPSGHRRTRPQVRTDKFDIAVATKLRYLYDTQTPLEQTTVDKLLRSRL
jgi:hypothetical protein